VDFLLVLIELFLLGLTAQVLRAKKNWKSALCKRCGSIRQIFMYKGTSPPIISARIVKSLNALQLCRWQFSHKQTFFKRSAILHRKRPFCHNACVWQMERWTDRQTDDR